jgi:hypothetical protein
MYDNWQLIDLADMDNVESTIVDIIFAKIHYRKSKHSLYVLIMYLYNGCAWVPYCGFLVNCYKQMLSIFSFAR